MGSFVFGLKPLIYNDFISITRGAWARSTLFQKNAQNVGKKTGPSGPASLIPSMSGRFIQRRPFLS